MNETHYHRRERHRIEAAAERGDVIAELLKPRSPYDKQTGHRFIGLRAALAQWFAGIRRRRKETENG